MFENRTYRRQHRKKGLVSFEITVKETNLNIQARHDLTNLAIKSVLDCRNYIENYISLHPEFATTLVPLPFADPMPLPVKNMVVAAGLARVGPMAAVAGAVAEFTGQVLLEMTPEVLIENGGDIFVKSESDTTFGIYAGNSPLTRTFGIQVKKRPTAYGMCTSSGMFGHSKSFGKADAVCVLSNSCPLADAAATALCNRIQTKKDIKSAIDAGKIIPGIQGIVIIKGDQIGLWGDLELIRISP